MKKMLENLHVFFCANFLFSATVYPQYIIMVKGPLLCSIDHYSQLPAGKKMGGTGVCKPVCIKLADTGAPSLI